MTNDTAVFLDLDNLAIGAKQANLVFDVNLLLAYIKNVTNGRIVFRYACGAAQQNQGLLQELAQAGFIVQSATPLNSFSKNLADMQIVVSAMDTLIDGHQYHTYVLMSGDRDFTPLVQSLRKRGKHVIGVGVRHTTSSSLSELCDQYIYYEDVVPGPQVGNLNLEALLVKALDEASQGKGRVRASVLNQHMMDISKGLFDQNAYPQGNFRKFLSNYPHLVQLEQDGSTTYVIKPSQVMQKPLHLRYRSELKKNRLRIVLPPTKRFHILRELITYLQNNPDIRWRDLLEELAAKFVADKKADMSKNLINSVMLLARQAGIVRTPRANSLSAAYVFLELAGEHIFQEAVVLADRAYLQAIVALPEPFDMQEAAIALYEKPEYTVYLQRLSQVENSTT